MNQQNHDRLEQATASRLTRLAGRPVDTTNLAQQLTLAMESQTAALPNRRTGWQAWWRPITAATAAIVIVAVVGWFFTSSGPAPAMAAPAYLAQIHHDVVNGYGPNLKVASVEEANQLLADQANGVVEVPELPGMMMSCCLHEHEGTTLTCALIELDGRFVTVAIADRSKMHSPKGRLIERGGRKFTVHQANGITMVMTNRDNRWMCVMGQVNESLLIDIALGINL